LNCFLAANHTMSDGITPSRFSPHNDLISVTPKTLSEKLSLVEEIKSRAKSSIKVKNYQEAEMLYTLAISRFKDEDSVKKQSSVLYSNRSLSRYQIEKFDLAVEDARESIRLDSTYAKGHWRLGQALFRLQRYGEAKDAYAGAIEKLGLKEGAWKKEMDRCAEKQKGLRDAPTKPTKKMQSASPKKPSVEINKPSKPSTDAIKISKEEEFSSSDVVRGYKIVDGKKTSFFHHEQSEEEKRLIGDIAPKRCAPTAKESTPKDVSAWNTAGTWEEKNVTTWAKGTLSAALLLACHREGDAEACVTKVESLEGHASVATVRGKRRYIYEFSVCLCWKVEQDDGDSCGGKLSLPDVDGTVTGEYDVTEFIVKEGELPSGLIDSMVKKGGLKGSIFSQIDQWVRDFKAQYELKPNQ